MLPFIFLVFAFATTIALGILIRASIKQDVARVFPEDYATLKQAHPYPLRTIRFVSGRLAAKTTLPFRFGDAPLRFNSSLRFRATLKLDIYSDMLVVSTLGQALRLPYAHHMFQRQKTGPCHTLSVANLPVREKSGAATLPNPVDFDRTTTLTIQLAGWRLDGLKGLIQQVQGPRH